MKIFFATVLFLSTFAGDIFAQCVTNVSGTISGRWTLAGSPYCVTGNVSVATLTIDPGVVVIFRGAYRFDVDGILTAIGTQQDSIVFRKDTSTSIAAWKGIVFNSSPPGSELGYCVIRGSDSSGIRINNSTTGVYPTVRNCRISNNSAKSGLGGGVYVNGSAKFTGCWIVGNLISAASGAAGAGIYAVGRIELENCIVRANSVSATVNCPAAGCTGTASGGGAYVSGVALLKNCRFDSNRVSITMNGTFPANSRGGGLFVSGSFRILNSIFSHNRVLVVYGAPANRHGGGIYCSTSADTSVVQNCTIVYNSDEGLRTTIDTLRILNSIVYFNTPDAAQIVGNAKVKYSDVFGGYPDPDSTNINFNPVFLSTSCLQIIPPSPCLDAGDTARVYNDACFVNGNRRRSWGSPRNDMGAHGGPGACDWDTSQLCIIVTSVSNAMVMPRQFSLSQNYPNPFNPETKINFQIPQTGDVSLKIYDVLGREVATLVSERMNPGTYSASWDATGFASGVYLYRMKAGGFAETKNLILLR